MTKKEVKDIIKDKAMEYGFEVGEMDGWHGFPDIISEELNFTYDNELTENTVGRNFELLRELIELRKAVKN